MHHGKFSSKFKHSITHLYSLGFNQSLLESRAGWLKSLQECASLPSLEVPPQKIFTPKMGLPRLESYGRVCPGEAYWNNWPSNQERVGRSRIDGEKLRLLATEAGIRNTITLDRVVEDLRHGARIGCQGVFREPSVSKNTPMAYEAGEQVSDAVSEWVREGYARGPVDKKDLPEDAKVSGIMTKIKPNGSVRVILNLSSPVGRSVNEGIDNSQFPASMSSTTKWLRILHRAGKNCYIVKFDRRMASKQMALHAEDLTSC